MHAARSRGLGPAAQATFLEHVAHDHAHPPHVVPGHSRSRIQVHAELVRMLEVVGAHRVRVQIDAAQVHDPEKLRRVPSHDLPGGAAGRETQLDGLDPVGMRLGRALLVEGLALGALHIAFEDDRPRLDPSQRRVRDRQVILRQVQLRVADLREEHLFGVRDRDIAARRLQGGHGSLRHRRQCGTLSATGGAGSDGLTAGQSRRQASAPVSLVYAMRTGMTPKRS